MIFCLLTLYLYRPYDKDRYMAPDIDAVTKLLIDNKIWLAARHHIDFYHEPQVRFLKVSNFIIPESPG